MKKILIVDDSPFMRLLLKKILEGKNCQIIESTGADEAVEIYFREKPDVILLDIVMPRVKGTEVLKKIKAKDPKAKVIMITVVGREEVVQQCRRLGVSDYITKPFEDSQVKNAVEKCLHS